MASRFALHHADHAVGCTVCTAFGAVSDGLLLALLAVASTSGCRIHMNPSQIAAIHSETVFAFGASLKTSSDARAVISECALGVLWCPEHKMHQVVPSVA